MNTPAIDRISLFTTHACIVFPGNATLEVPKASPYFREFERLALVYGKPRYMPHAQVKIYDCPIRKG